MSSHLILGKLHVWRGNMVVYPVLTASSLLRERYLQIGHHLNSPWCNINQAFPMPGGGNAQLLRPFIAIWDLTALWEPGSNSRPSYGTGSRSQSHAPGDRAAGRNTHRGSSKEHPELQAAIDAWGLLEDEESRLLISKNKRRNCYGQTVHPR